MFVTGNLGILSDKSATINLIDLVPSRVLRETGGKLQEMILGQATPEEAMQKAQQVLEEVLKGR